MHEPLPRRAAVQPDVNVAHILHRDYETRSQVDLRKVGAARYAADPSTEVLCAAFAVDDGPAQLWRPGDPVPPEYFEAAANPSWVVCAHNDAFESAIEQHLLHPRHGFPLIPPERHRCTQAACLALGLPARLGLLADVLELANRKDDAGERLMHQMSKPRKPRKGEDPKGVYWHEDDERLQRLGAYCMRDVEAERELHGRLQLLSDAEQALWMLVQRINARGFHVDRKFAEAARQIAKAAAPEINAELAELTGGAVTGINQIAKLAQWLQQQGCTLSKLDRKAIDKLLSDDELLHAGAYGVRSSCGSAAPRRLPRRLTVCWPGPAAMIGCAAPSVITAPAPAGGLEKGFSRKISSARSRKISTPPSPQSRPATINTSSDCTRSRSRSSATAAARQYQPRPATC